MKLSRIDGTEYSIQVPSRKALPALTFIAHTGFANDEAVLGGGMVGAISLVCGTKKRMLERAWQCLEGTALSRAFCAVS
jgi:phage tail tube protein FII